MNWRPQYEATKQQFEGKVASDHTRQSARKLMRNIAKMETRDANRAARKAKRG